MEGNKNTGLIDCNCLPILVGDKFRVTKHQNECCNHWVICEVKEDLTCRCGYGLFSVETGELISNAAIANYRV